MKIIIETVPHEQNRCGQVGDYKYLEDGTLYITVSDLKNKDYECLVAVHELWEVLTTEANGISEESITAYDEEYEKRREAGLVPIDSENGFWEDCNYKKWHMQATAVEMMLAAELGIDWNSYSKTVNEL